MSIVEHHVENARPLVEIVRTTKVTAKVGLEKAIAQNQNIKSSWN